MNEQILISYRRQKSRWSTKGLRDSLCRDFDPKQFVMYIGANCVGGELVETIETESPHAASEWS
jgi:hypothetical protein